jgi:hypothetical protein
MRTPRALTAAAIVILAAACTQSPSAPADPFVGAHDGGLGMGTGNYMEDAGPDDGEEIGFVNYAGGVGMNGGGGDDESIAAETTVQVSDSIGRGGSYGMGSGN